MKWERTGLNELYNDAQVLCRFFGTS